MDSIITDLNKRFDIALQESTDKEFYLNLYHYFDYIETTKEIKSIFDQSERDYYTKFREIKLKNATGQTDTETAKGQLRKLELFNLYALGCGIYMRIYLAISEYRKTDEVDDLQDPVIVLLFYGIEYAKKLKRWENEYLKQYNNWFGGKRSMYEAELKQFHLLMLEELAKQKPVVTPPENTAVKVPLYLNLTTGDFIFHSTRETFSPATQEFKVLSTLLYSKDYVATHLELYKAIHPNTERISKTQRDQLSLIIRNIKRKLNILPKTEESNPDIFKSIPKIGYSLVFKHSSVIPE
ncbi:MAG: hypothetical protein KBB50_01390 [Candidatus Pacebacteria bacterium]|nr:hypothetical protein [Candidatus Paceibacterota bacterium]